MSAVSTSLNHPQSTQFARTGRFARGYQMDQVDAFLEQARQAYESPETSTALTSRDVREVAFDLVRGGYEVTEVDGALDRLEDALARKELDRARSGGKTVHVDRRRHQIMRMLRGRCERPDGERFDRGSGFEHSYDIDDVDRLCRRLIQHLDEGAGLTANEVRRAVFGTRRGSRGYSEAQVDAFCDRVVELLTASL